MFADVIPATMRQLLHCIDAPEDPRMVAVMVCPKD